MKNKLNSHIFSEVFTEMAKSDWIGSRKWWTNYIFHFTNINNAVEILKQKRLCSRQKALSEGLMVTDNASRDVIAITEEKRKQYVRFYFRPRTPTQFHNEGFKSVNQKEHLNAHCPVPVFFLFDSLAMLSRTDSYFTYGNLARNPDVYCKSEDFRGMPFQNVYHDQWHYEDQITFNRHAEVIIPNECDLNDLKYVVCRSQAEKETLINVYNDFSANTIDSYKVLVKPSLHLFFRKWFYIDKVTLSEQCIVFEFNKGENRHAEYDFCCEFEKTDTGEVKVWRDPNFNPGNSLKLNFKNGHHQYILSVYIDGHLAYKGKYHRESGLPF
ncbi:DarT ssDNA thymidine ADP-ribosyltransferase family protein [Bacillus sp. FSL K6-1338]|uniref:DarT ssDNA thymidine ADP-ribosyltransferase family protein n=1 Tax=Bacillus sp. FSL K6-1338 TaxID=2976833 RepID=UPI0030F902D6